MSSTGGVYVGAMTTSPTIDLGGGPLACAGSCIALAALDRDGTSLWSKLFASGATATASAMSVDVTSSIALGGSLFATADFGGPPLVAPACTSEAAPDAFVVRYDGDGFYLWASRFGDCDYQAVTALRTYGTRIVIGGAFQSSIDFGLGALSAVGARDLFLAELDGPGAALWSKSFGGVGSTSKDAVVSGIGFDADGDVFITGSFTDTLDLGGGPLVSAGSADVFVARFDEDGNHVWSRRFGDAGDQRGVDLWVDGAGDVVLTGSSTGAIDLGGGALAGEGVFVAMLDGEGRHRWSKLFAGTHARPARVRLGVAGEALVTGEFSGAFDVGGGPLSGGGVDRSSMFACALTASGAHEWSRGFGTATSGVVGSAIDLDPGGAPIVLGAFDGTIDLAETYATFGDRDGFVAKLAR